MGDQDTGYNDEASDFKRKSARELDQEEDSEETNKQSEKAQEYIRNILAERLALDRKYPIADRLLEVEVETVHKNGKPPARRYIDIYREKPIKVQVKVLVPVKEHPKFNFVGKLLGPKGNSLKRLQEETMCKMAILGRGSMKDRKKEEELRLAMDPKYAHLNDDLHVEINALGPPAEAHARIAYALAEVRKFLIPDSNDFIRQEQMREMLEDPDIELPVRKVYKKALAPAAPPPSSHEVPAPPSSMISKGGSSTLVHQSSRTRPPPKKVLSILDKARVAMEETHISRSSSLRYEDSRYEHDQYEASYAYHPPPPAPRPKYETSDYEHDYRREYYRDSVSSYAPHKTTTPSMGGRHWKQSGYGGSSSRDDISSKHHAARDLRSYRHAPYARPSKPTVRQSQPFHNQYPSPAYVYEHTILLPAYHTQSANDFNRLPAPLFIPTRSSSTVANRSTSMNLTSPAID